MPAVETEKGGQRAKGVSHPPRFQAGVLSQNDQTQVSGLPRVAYDTLDNHGPIRSTKRATTTVAAVASRRRLTKLTHISWSNCSATP